MKVPGFPKKSSRGCSTHFIVLRNHEAGRQAELALGLAIARSIVQAHRGEIVLSNRPTGGLRAESYCLDEWLITAAASG